MVVTDRRGSLADVRAARRALSAKFEPSTYFYLAWAAVFAVLCGSRSSALELVAALALTAASIAATSWQSRRARFTCPRRIQLFSRRAFVLASLFSLLGMVVVLAMAGSLVAALWQHWPVLSHRGTPMAYAVPFVVFIAPTMAALKLPWLIDPHGIDARPMRKVPDQPAVVNPVIEPRQRIIVCATLAGADWIEARFLANTLQIPDEGLHQRTAELIAAKYVDVHSHNGRWWFGLTAIGRAAYRRHLRALQLGAVLQRSSIVQPIVAADGLATR